MSKPICIFCGKSTSKLQEFDDEKLKRCREILDVRKKCNIKYSKISIPSSVNSSTKYHSDCYQNFTALNSKYIQKCKDLTTSASTSKESRSIQDTENVGVLNDDAIYTENKIGAVPEDIPVQYNFEDTSIQSHSEIIPENDDSTNECVICEKVRKKINSKLHKCTMCSDINIIQKLKSRTLELKKLDIFSRIGDKKIIFYHRKCKIGIDNKFRLSEISKKEKNEWHRVREENERAFSVVIDFVKTHVIEEKKSIFLSFLKMLFEEELKKLHGTQTKNKGASRYVEEKLLNIFKNEISVRFVKNTKIVVPYGYTILENDLPNLSSDNDIRQTALRLK